MQELERIRRLRGLSQKNLADKAHIAEGTVAGIEAGRHTPRASTSRKLAAALGVEVADLYGEAIPKEQAPTSPQLGEERRWIRAWADTFENVLNVARGYLHGHVQEDDSKPVPVEVALRLQHLYSNLGRVMESEGGWERLALLEEAQDPDALRLLQAAESLHGLGGLANRLTHAPAEEKLEQELNDLREGLAKTESGTPHGA